MKRTTVLFLACFLGISVYPQKRASLPENLRDYAVIKPLPGQNHEFANQISDPTIKSAETFYDEVQVGMTRYDDQSNASMQNRLCLFGDGTIGATWIFGIGETSFTDRGTGYNYFDGTAWGLVPDARVEDERTGWPSYAPLGETGEIVVSHTVATGLKISRRTQKGTGDWIFSLLEGPDGHHMLWNRTITSGTNHDRVHALALTLPVSHAGTPYAGLDGALVYSLSLDGGDTWSITNTILDGMTANEYYGFSSDIYSWAEPKGDVLAFVVGESWSDMFLMKSEDGGESFEKTIIWENPYPFYNTQVPTATDTFYCADGAHSLVIDESNMVHVVFGINRALSDGTSLYWFPFVDGVGYWNEDMDSFSNDVNALSPYGDPGSELIEDYNLIGWTQDVDGDGVITFIGEIGTYYLGLSSMPQLVINSNDLYLVYSSVTETYENGTANYRHLWERHSLDGGATWEEFTDLTSDLIHIFDECVYPSCAANTDENMYLIYQKDNEPGNAVWAAQHDYVNNDIVMMTVPIFPTSITKTRDLQDNVSQNYPNPFDQYSEVSIILAEVCDLSIEVADQLGQKVWNSRIYKGTPGKNTISIDGSGLSSGLYFYTVKAGKDSVTKKMTIQ
ncbi:MAG: T9SS type A sorting domain-containing protein [Bacteroidetes bacterium]|nr:T9SS type A sorting domain-containing protein [Bacteroidota bacterium]